MFDLWALRSADGFFRLTPDTFNRNADNRFFALLLPGEDQHTGDLSVR
jgi:hypothetical protein